MRGRVECSDWDVNVASVLEGTKLQIRTSAGAANTPDIAQGRLPPKLLLSKQTTVARNAIQIGCPGRLSVRFRPDMNTGHSGSRRVQLIQLRDRIMQSS